MAPNNDSKSPFGNELTTDLLAALLVLVLVSLCLTGGLFAMRRYRKSKQDLLPTHNDSNKLAPRRPHHKRSQSSHSISATSHGGHAQPVYVFSEKKESIQDRAASPPPGNLPEIRITLPEEVDEQGKRQAGRVVVVHIGENGVTGVQPLEEFLPPYQQHASERFQSLDLERIGGLKEKA